MNEFQTGLFTWTQWLSDLMRRKHHVEGFKHQTEHINVICLVYIYIYAYMYPYDIIVVIQSWAALVEGSSRIQNASGDGKSIRYWEAPNPNKTMSLRFNSPAFGSISFYFQDSVCSQTVRMISRRKYQYIKHHILGWTLSIAIITADVPVMFIYFAVHQVTNLLMRNHIKYHLSPFT